MSLSDYIVRRDHFQPKQGRDFCFPCFACAFVDAPTNAEPCRSCDHNASAVPEVVTFCATETIDDGFGGVWSKTCPECGRKSMQVVRPGKVQCAYCG
jgi:hypothetical protein